MDYISVREAAERWCVSERWIQKLCEEGRIDGVKTLWAFMDDSERCKKAK